MNRFFVLDTNVLLHDPAALFRFQEHDIFVPMVVLEELDRGKKGVSEIARNARQASRFLDALVQNANQNEIRHGIPLNLHHNLDTAHLVKGRLYLQTEALNAELPQSLPGLLPDNALLATAIALQRKRKDVKVTLVTKDINLRIKAAVLGLHAEDYYNDQVLDDADLLYSGITELPEDFWRTHGQSMDSWKDGGRTYYRIAGPMVADWYPNQFLFSDQENSIEAIVLEIDRVNNSAIIEWVEDYSQPRHAVWGINARNREQNFAMNLLLDPEIDFVSLVGAAGTGKTLLALAAGLVQTLEDSIYREIIMTRLTIPVGEDIGFLPGTEEEKMTPWMGALMDNLEVLTQPESGGKWGRAVTNDLLHNRIRIRSLNFMRGRTFLNRYIILDEAQNLTSKQMKTLITRAGPGSKVVALGNIAQIDTPYLTETTSGLTYVVDRFRNWTHSGHVTLTRGERSRLADFASQNL